MNIINKAKTRKRKGWIAAVGFFDGVHAGHRYFIREMQQIASERKLATAIFTFRDHPRSVVQEGFKPKLLNSLDEKLKQLATTAIDYCVLMDFTQEFAAYSARDFIVKILSEQWLVHSLLIGYDHRFGHNRSDGFDEYVKYGKSCGMDILQVSSYNRNEKAVSSSQIRQLLSECRVEEAAKLLTYPYRLKGHVVSGLHYGRILGFPTANIKVDDPLKIHPGMGVYAVWVYVVNEQYKGMLTIGNRPTLSGEEVTIEVHVLHFSRSIYRYNIEVEFMYYLRDNIKFDNPEALKVQLKKDRQRVEELLTVNH